MITLSSTITSDNGSNTLSTTRLLWRGSLVTQAGLKLHGLAIVAHSIDLTKNLKVKQDPFSASAPPQALSDTCLEIEMLRGRDLRVRKPAKLVLDQTAHERSKGSGPKSKKSSRRKAELASLLKGKGVESDQIRQIPISEIECDPEVKLYLDPRCSKTHNWIMSQICKGSVAAEGLVTEALVITLDQAIDDKVPQELIIFAKRLPDDSACQSTSHAPIPLQLFIGQRKPADTSRLPRPDDPMPRESGHHRFTESLKRTGLKKPLNTDSVPLVSHDFRPFGLFDDNVISSKSSKDTLRGAQRLISKPTKKPANTPGRRPDKGPSSDVNSSKVESSIPGARGEKRQHENLPPDTSKKVKIATNLLTESYRLPEVFQTIEEDDDDDEKLSESQCLTYARSPSPSPGSFVSRQNSHLPTPDTLISSSDAKLQSANQSHIDNPSRAQPASQHTNSRGPIGSEALHSNCSMSQIPSGHHLHQNKQLIRRLAADSLTARGIDKGDTQFRELFGAVCRGVQFAMRELLETKSIDKILTKSFIESHLAMYMIVKAENED